MSGDLPPDGGVDLVLTSKDDLQDSEMTPPTESGSLSEDEVGSWLGAIGTDFKNIATCFKKNTLPVLGGVANLVHKTAMSVAAEIAQLERDGELEGDYWREESQGLDEKDLETLSLPWEISQKFDGDDVSVYITDEDLMEEILALSLLEKTFLEPFTSPAAGSLSSVDRSEFILDQPRINLIRRLLDIDDNLAATHARLSGRSDVRETIFWKNYFYHCEEARNKSLYRQNKSSQPRERSIEEEEIATDEVNSSALDSSSLILDSADDEDSSYVNVVPSAPNSLNTFASTKSVDDLVVVGHHATRK